jgi:L-2-hydroxyglutarate oxidase LhgO
LYDYCHKHSVDNRKTGKLVVAHSSQLDYIRGLHEKAQTFGKTEDGQHLVPTSLISGDEARDLEPDLSPQIAGALVSPETGIIDSHGLMESFEKDIQDTDSSELVYDTRVVRVDPSSDGWIVQTVTGDGTEGDSMLARTVINSSGLSATLVLNSLLPEGKRLPAYFARGSYASYKGRGAGVKKLIYPCPDKTDVTFAHLGTHLTLDLQGQVRFGPDIEWLSPPEEETSDESLSGFWQRHLVPSDDHMQEIHRAVTTYLPKIALEGLQPDYVGVRPKLIGPDGGFQDFVVQKNFPSEFKADGAREAAPMISLLG